MTLGTQAFPPCYSKLSGGLAGPDGGLATQPSRATRALRAGGLQLGKFYCVKEQKHVARQRDLQRTLLSFIAYSVHWRERARAVTEPAVRTLAPGQKREKKQRAHLEAQSAEKMIQRQRVVRHAIAKRCCIKGGPNAALSSSGRFVDLQRWRPKTLTLYVGCQPGDTGQE